MSFLCTLHISDVWVYSYFTLIRIKLMGKKLRNTTYSTFKYKSNNQIHTKIKPNMHTRGKENMLLHMFMCSVPTFCPLPLKKIPKETLECQWKDRWEIVCVSLYCLNLCYEYDHSQRAADVCACDYISKSISDPDILNNINFLSLHSLNILMYLYIMYYTNRKKNYNLISKSHSWNCVPSHPPLFYHGQRLTSFSAPHFVKMSSTEKTVCRALCCHLIQPQILMWVGIHKKAFLLCVCSVSVFARADIKDKIQASWPLA